MATVGTGLGTTASPKPEGKGDNVQVSKASQTTEYEKSLQIVVGTVSGVVGFLGILIIGALIYRFCKNRRNRQAGSDRNTSVHRSVSIDLEQKQVPSVLLLYSYDCSAHEKVVESLAGFLIETCNCNVHLDIFEEQIIHERGLDEWLVDRLQEAEFIIVLSSIGARLRCCKKKVKFKIDPTHTLPDYFAVAVDYVAEKMRVERSKGMPLTTFCVAYMDYSLENDIPPQLEMGFKFCLMKDITALFCHLHGINGEPTKDGQPMVGISEDTYETTELGQELKVAIESAKEYFRANPGWVEESIEPVLNPGKSKSRHARKSSLEPLLSPCDKDLSQMDVKRNIPLPNELHSQTLPKLNLHHTQIPLIPLQNRQNSFPSSLSSHQTLSTPPLHPKSSRSCENMQQPDLVLPVCPVCSGAGCCECQNPQFLTTQECENGEVRSKSKSMPAISRVSLYGSQTIFQAEVHKEWDDQDGHLSQCESQETQSNHDSVIDDLEHDLDSIMNPSSLMVPLHYSHTSYDNIAGTYTAIPLTGPLVNLNEVNPVRVVQQAPKGQFRMGADQKRSVQYTLSEVRVKNNYSDNIQLQDLRL